MPTQPSSSNPNCRALRVLIVDDVPQVRQELRGLLQLTGELNVVGEAANGWEAVTQAESLRPDVVVIDLEMPVLDGYEATRRIKALYSTCRVIALTIHAGEVERRKAFQAGADVFVVKGAPLETLVEAIHNASASGQALKGDAA